MIIADTSIWIDFLKGDEEVKPILSSYLKRSQVVAVSAIFGELLQGTKNKREREIIAGFWAHLPKLEEGGLFIHAGLLSNKHHLYAKGVGLIDCYLLAAALQYDYALWTKDKKLMNAMDIISEA